MPYPKPASPEVYDDLDIKIQGLTNEPSLYKKCEVLGEWGYCRGGHLDLADALQRIAQLGEENTGRGDAKPITEINIYADFLTARNPACIPPKCTNLTLVSRVAFERYARPIEIVWQGSRDLRIELHCIAQEFPITIKWSIGNDEAPIFLTIDPAMASEDHRFWVVHLSTFGSLVLSRTGNEFHRVPYRLKPPDNCTSSYDIISQQTCIQARQRRCNE
jgi:hypothetical protein